MSRTVDREVGSLAERLLVEAGGEELEPMIRCPKWHGCSAPICPLDPHKGLRVGPVGGEVRCTLSKAKRRELGALLPWRGLWPAELAGLRGWEARGAEGRRQLVAAGRETRFAPVESE